MAHWNSHMWYLQGFPSAVVYSITAPCSGKFMSFSQTSCSAVYIPIFSIPFLQCICSSAFWCFSFGTCFLGTWSFPPLDLLPHHLLLPAIPAPLFFPAVLVQFFLHALEKAVQRCNVRQCLMKKEGMDLRTPWTCKSLTLGILLALAGAGCSRWLGWRNWFTQNWQDSKWSTTALRNKCDYTVA